MELHEMKVIARIRSDFSEKFGIPHQSGLVPELQASLVFEPEFRNPEALRGIEGFSHLWLIWQFSKAVRENWSPTVRPPRLGGNTRMGVFATRSPFRPNAIGLSCVRLEAVELQTPEGPILRIRGADLLDGTPIYDIKPYVPYADCVPDAAGGFAASAPDQLLTIADEAGTLERIPAEKRAALLGVLRQDPRPSYQEDPDRIYGLQFAGYDVRFQVRNGILIPVSAEKLSC